MRLHLPRPPLPYSAARSVQAPFELWLHSNLPDNCAASSVLSPLAPAIGHERLPSKLVRCDDEYAVWLRIADVNNSQISPARSLTYSNAGAFSPRTVLPGIRQDVLHFFLIHAVVRDVWLTCRGIEVEAKLHRSQYRRESGRGASRHPRPVLVAHPSRR